MLGKAGLFLDQIWETQQMFSRFEEAIYRRGLTRHNFVKIVGKEQSF